MMMIFMMCLKDKSVRRWKGHGRSWRRKRKGYGILEVVILELFMQSY